MIHLSNPSDDCDTHFFFFKAEWNDISPPKKLIFPHRRSWVQECFTNTEQGVVSVQKQPASVYSQQCHYLRNRRRGGERELCPLCGQQSGAERRGEDGKTFLICYSPKKTLNMSMYGSNPKLYSMGPRSNSRPDLTSASFRGEVFAGGNGFQDFQDGGGYTHTTFTRSSMHGGGLGTMKVSGGGGGGGGMRWDVWGHLLLFKLAI